MTDGIVIAGGGLAAQRAAETLRRAGYAGGLRMVCAEPRPPYDRPPLSKELLTAERRPDSVRFRSDGWYVENEVDLLLGVRAAVLWPDERVLHLSDGSALRYDQLLIATGARPRELPALVGYRNVSTLRSLTTRSPYARCWRPRRGWRSSAPGLWDWRSQPRHASWEWR